MSNGTTHSTTNFSAIWTTNWSTCNNSSYIATVWTAIIATYLSFIHAFNSTIITTIEEANVPAFFDSK